MDRELTAITSEQMGLVTRCQLGDLGLSQHAVQHLIRSHHLVRMSSRVLLLDGAPITDLVRARCATLDADAVLSGRSAAALWGAPGHTLAPVHVMRLRGGRVRSSHVAVVHEPRQVIDEHLTVHRGVPVLRPRRLMFDLAAVDHPGRVERTLDWFWSRRLVNVAGLERVLRQVAARGRPGITLMRRLIEDRRDLPAPGSSLELRFATLVERAGLPPFERQVNLGDEFDWLGRVDFVSTIRLLVVEIDSELHHNALSDRLADEARRAALDAAGFMVRSLDERDLFHETSAAIGKLQRWYEEARSR